MKLSNLSLLKQDMVDKNWTICSFIFKYKNIEYIVLVKRFIGSEKRVNKYALVKLHFMKSKDLNDDLEVEANISKLIISAKELREYFGIEYNNNLGDILQQFTERLGGFIPQNILHIHSDIENIAMVTSLSKSDSEDPNKVYCYGVRRNPSNGRRSEFNSDKTKILYPKLYDCFRNDESISFCYSSDKLKEKDEEFIVRNFSMQTTGK
jgi:hypothetical protein